MARRIARVNRIGRGDVLVQYVNGAGEPVRNDLLRDIDRVEASIQEARVFLPGYRDGDWVRAKADIIAALRQPVDDQDAEKLASSAIDDAWGEMPGEWLSEPPPPARYLLRQPLKNGMPCGDPRSMGDGFLRRGKAGALSSEGGVGKGYAMIQLAISVVTGRDWLRYFAVDRDMAAGKALLILAEEDADEARRRLYSVCRALELGSEERGAVRDGMVILSMHGKRCGLLQLDEAGRVIPTSNMERLKARLDDDPAGFDLVVLDPQARLAGLDVESNNQVATEFVQHCESITDCKGNPTVIVTSHSSKYARRLGTADSRGVGGLTDGFRWAMTLKKEKDAIVMELTKNNLAPPLIPDSVRLVRSQRGALFAETKEEREEGAKKCEFEARDKLEQDVRKVFLALQREGSSSSKDAIYKMAGIRAARGRAALATAIDRQWVLKDGTARDPIFRPSRPSGTPWDGHSDTLASSAR